MPSRAACEVAAGTPPSVARALGGLRGLLAEFDADAAIRRPDADAERQRADLRRDLESQKFALDQHAIVSVTDTEGRILDANEKFCMLTGYTHAELVGTNHRIVSSGIHRPEFYAKLWRTIASGPVWHGEICNRSKSGALQWVDASMTDAGGAVTGMIGAIFDTTERKVLERRLEDAKDAAEAASRARSGSTARCATPASVFPSTNSA